MHPARATAAPYTQALPPAPQHLGQVRATFRTWSAPFVADPTLRADLVLAVSELCATAMRGARHEDGQLVVTAWIDERAVVVEVRDRRGDVLESTVRGLDGPDAGRALSIVASLTDVLTVRAVPGSTFIRVRKEDAIP
jgi:anti-sigma regulatory factor (Ser/Thr protein kinase)